MSLEWHDIASVVEARRREDSDIIREMASVRDRYSGDYIIPLGDVDGEPSLPPTAPALIAAAIDSTAMLAASVQPTIVCPALHDSDTSRNRAQTRERALYANWRFSQFKLLRRRAMRHLAAYGTYSYITVPDFEAQRAKVELRDPLSSYPEVRAIDDIRAPRNVAYVFGRSVEWLARTFPDNANLRKVVDQPGLPGDRLWDVVEWIDENEIVMGVLGPREKRAYSSSFIGDHHATGGFELKRWPNKAGMVPAVVPRRITLEKVAGQVSQTVGLFDLMNRLMALDIVAAEKAIFPDRYIVGQDGRAPQLVSGEWKDGRSGEMNIVLDAQTVGELVSASGPLVHPVIDRIERAIRISGGVTPFFTGETVGSLRTGRAMDSLASQSVDPRLQEMHEIDEEATRVINESIIAIEKGYFGSKKFVVSAGTRGAREQVTYKPDTDFETTDNDVFYPIPGMDAAQLAVILPQRVGAGMMARSTAMRLDPYIDDPVEEDQRITIEQIREAVKQSMLTQASQGTLPLVDLARIEELVDEGKSIAEAIRTAQTEAQERQASQVQPGAPEAQPGLSEPGVGVEAQEVNPFPEVPAGLNRAAELGQVLGAIRRGARV